jgi:hypothetical protein
MTSVAKCLGQAEIEGTTSLALAHRPPSKTPLVDRCRATLISSGVSVTSFYGAFALRCANSSRIMFCGVISSGAHCVELPKNHPPCHAHAKDVKPPFREIEQKGVEQRADDVLCNDD